LQLFLVRPRNLAGPWKAGNLEALVYFKFNRYQAVLRFFEVPWTMDFPEMITIAIRTGILLVLCGICSSCSTEGQGMTDYQRSQLQLQQQQLDQQALDSARQSAQNNVNNAIQLLNPSTPEYGVDPNQSQTSCVTGTDYLGRIVTQCSTQGQ